MTTPSPEAYVRYFERDFNQTEICYLKQFISMHCGETAEQVQWATALRRSRNKESKEVNLGNPKTYLPHWRRCMVPYEEWPAPTGLEFVIDYVKVTGPSTDGKKVAWSCGLILIYERGTQSLFHKFERRTINDESMPERIWSALSDADCSVVTQSLPNRECKPTGKTEIDSSATRSQNHELGTKAVLLRKPSGVHVRNWVERSLEDFSYGTRRGIWKFTWQGRKFSIDPNKPKAWTAEERTSISNCTELETQFATREEFEENLMVLSTAVSSALHTSDKQKAKDKSRIALWTSLN